MEYNTPKNLILSTRNNCCKSEMKCILSKRIQNIFTNLKSNATKLINMIIPFSIQYLIIVKTNNMGSFIMVTS